MSSQIEGTQSSLSDLLLFELDEAPGLRSAMWWRCRTMSPHSTTDCAAARGFPALGRLLREIHAVLLSRGRGSGGTRRVPTFAELDRRHPARQRGVRSAAATAVPD